MSRGGEFLDPRVTQLYHIHSYAMARALTRMVGPAQAAMIKVYADYFSKLCGTIGLCFENVSDFSSALKAMKLVSDLRVERSENGKVRIIVEGCALAPMTHEPLGMKGYTGDICPLAMMAMVFLAREKGWKPGDNLFDYIKFAEKLSYFTENGTATDLQEESRESQAKK